MPAPFEYLLLMAAGVVAGIVNTVAGGGTLLTLPALIAFGLSPAVANGTNRIAVVLQALVGSFEFHKQGNVDYRLLKQLGPALVLGSVAGAWLASALDAHRFESAFGVLLIGMGASMLLEPRHFDAAQPRRRPRWLVAVTFFVIGLLAGFIQAGVGILLVSAMVLLLRVDAVLANSVKLALVLLLTVPALAVFVIHDQVALVPGLVLSVGNAAGAWLGVRIAVGIPVSVLRAVIALVAAGTGLALLW